ncbi:hypothetical protein NIES2100_43110 [Calothrix sp. NIES-2100]|uniref:hypothetical protein n=1 Tax=Calothrix sp. NIES-2100 TaxID=1954172 RepID=UPI000B5EEB92|nr:hypothetical protein NIES2100_43110 [Calothrix sp. NIES-2100]
MKIADLEYLASITAENSIILSGGVSAVSSSSSLSEASRFSAFSNGSGFASAEGKTTYARAGSQVITSPLKKVPYIAVASSQALAYASK